MLSSFLDSQQSLHAEMEEYDEIAIGIDLGTTYSCVGVWRHDRVEIIPNEHGNRTTPSCVAFTDTDHLVGNAAMIQAAVNPLNTIFGNHICSSFIMKSCLQLHNLYV